jgi:Helix-turn-helix domain
VSTTEAPPIRWLKEVEAADYLRLAAATLRNWRSGGVGPRFHKLGGAVRYSLADLDAWADSQ